MIRVLLIRHGMTAGNLEKRYIGTTDEPLCREGIRQLKALSHLHKIPMPKAAGLFSSPQVRCLETAGILFPGQSPVIISDFREKDFGRYEGLSYKDLEGDEEYRRFVQSGGRLPFPAGEDSAGFKKRSVLAFQNCCDMLLKNGPDTAAFVLHGGTIMSILERFEHSKKDFYQWQVPPGKGFICRMEDNYQLRIEEKL